MSNLNNFTRPCSSLASLQSFSLILGIKFYGTPYTKKREGSNPAFALLEHELDEKWSQIPSDTDVLITHMPPYGIQDLNKHGGNEGCPDLLKAVIDRIKPKLHVFGHIHISGGKSESNETIFVNAAIGDKPPFKLPIVVNYNL